MEELLQAEQNATGWEIFSTLSFTIVYQHGYLLQGKKKEKSHLKLKNKFLCCVKICSSIDSLQKPLYDFWLQAQCISSLILATIWLLSQAIIIGYT